MAVVSGGGFVRGAAPGVADAEGPASDADAAASATAKMLPTLTGAVSVPK
jgi:hypothetical protein